METSRETDALGDTARKDPSLEPLGDLDGDFEESSVFLLFIGGGTSGMSRSEDMMSKVGGFA